VPLEERGNTNLFATGALERIRFGWLLLCYEGIEEIDFFYLEICCFSDAMSSLVMVRGCSPALTTLSLRLGLFLLTKREREYMVDLMPCALCAAGNWSIKC